MRLLSWLGLMLATNVSIIPTTALAQAMPAPTCRTGFVWREAFPSDHVCVSPEVRAQAAADNAATDRQQPDGAYGPKTCTSGFVWREAQPNDTVCVTPAIRAATAEDNRLAASRLATAASIPPAAKVREAPPIQRSSTELPAHGTSVPIGPNENPRCRDYANQAVADFKTMQSVQQCKVPPDGRWNPNSHTHYEWCVSATPAAISNEMHERSAHLLSCGAAHTL